jgi:hypothetical protein
MDATRLLGARIKATVLSKHTHVPLLWLFSALALLAPDASAQVDRTARKHAANAIELLFPNHQDFNYDRIDVFALRDGCTRKTYKVAVLSGGSTAWSEGAIAVLNRTNGLVSVARLHECFDVLGMRSIVRHNDSVAVIVDTTLGTDMLKSKILIYTIMGGKPLKTFQCEGDAHSYFPGSYYEREVRLDDNGKLGVRKWLTVTSKSRWYGSETSFTSNRPDSVETSRWSTHFDPQMHRFWEVQ